MPSVAIVGASNDRAKYANKAVRAHQARGFVVYPVHPRETEVEGLPAYRSVLDIPGPVDRVILYVPPRVGLAVIEEVARKGVKDLWVSPGAGESSSSCRGSSISASLLWVSANTGTACILTGHLGSSGSMREA